MSLNSTSRQTVFLAPRNRVFQIPQHFFWRIVIPTGNKCISVIRRFVKMFARFDVWLRLCIRRLLRFRFGTFLVFCDLVFNSSIFRQQFVDLSRNCLLVRSTWSNFLAQANLLIRNLAILCRLRSSTFAVFCKQCVVLFCIALHKRFGLGLAFKNLPKLIARFRINSSCQRCTQRTHVF